MLERLCILLLLYSYKPKMTRRARSLLALLLLALPQGGDGGLQTVSSWGDAVGVDEHKLEQVVLLLQRRLLGSEGGHLLLELLWKKLVKCSLGNKG